MTQASHGICYGDMGSENADLKGRILCVTSNYPRWEGDSTTPFVLRLAQDLQREGWAVDVLAPHAPGAATCETLAGLPTERFRYLWPQSLQTICYQGGALVNLRENPINYLKLPVFLAAETLAILRRLCTRSYDLVHAHWILPQGFTAALATRMNGVPLIISAHGGDVFALNRPLFNRFKRFALRRACAITANSSVTESAIRDLMPTVQNLHRIPASPSEDAVCVHAVRDIRQRYRTELGPLIVFVGRLVEEKGVDDLLRAVRLLSDQLRGIRCLVIGEGPHRSRFEQLAKDLGISEHVVFTGWVQPEEVTSYLAAADVFVGPSRRAPDGWVEAQGLTIVEAMLSGTPVIASKSGGIVDAVVDGRTGLLVPEHSPSAIADAVLRLMDDTSLRMRLATDAEQNARANLSRAAAARAFSRLFEDIIGIGACRNTP